MKTLSAAPFIGKRLQRYRLSGLSHASLAGDGSAAVKLAEIYLDQQDTRLRERAEKTMMSLPAGTARDSLCDFICRTPHPDLIRIARSSGIEPGSADRKAFFFAITGAWKRWEDPVISQVIPHIPEDFFTASHRVRMHILDTAANSGAMPVLTRALIVQDSTEPCTELSPDEWSRIFNGLAEGGHTGELRRLLFLVPLQQAREMVMMYTGRDTVPESHPFPALLRRFSRFIDGPVRFPERPVPMVTNLASPSTQVGRLAIPGPETLVTGSCDGSLRWWTLPSGTLTRTEPAHAGTITCLIPLGAAGLVASGGGDGQVKIWGGSRNPCVMDPVSHAGPVTALAATHDCSVIAAGYEDGRIVLWNARNGIRQRLWEQSHAGVTCISFGCNDAFLAAGCKDGALYILGQNQDCPAAIPGQGNPIRFLHVSSSGNTACLISGTGDRYIRIWSVPNGEHVKTLEIPGNIRCSAISGDGRNLACGCDDKTIRIFNLPDCTQTGEFAAHKDFFTTLAFTTYSKFLLSGSGDGSVRCWNMASQKLHREKRMHSRPVVRIAVSPDGAVTATCGTDGQDRLLQNLSLNPLRILNSHSSKITAAALARNGTLLVTGDASGMIRTWNAPGRQPVDAFDAYVPAILTLAAMPDGTGAICSGTDETVRLIDTVTGDIIRDFPAGKMKTWAIAVNSDVSRLATGGWDEKIRIWNLNDGELLSILTGHTSVITGLAFIPGTSSLISASKDRSIRTWNLPAGLPSGIFTGYNTPLSSICVSSDGKLAAAGGDDGIIRVIRLPQGELVRELKGHRDAVLCLTFHPMRTLLASGGRDSTVCLWSLPSGQAVRTIGNCGWDVTSCSFGPGGESLIVSGSDGTLCMITVPWVKPLALTTPGDLISVEETIAGFSRQNLEHEPWLFLEALLRDKFRCEIGCTGQPCGPAPYDFAIES